MCTDIWYRWAHLVLQDKDEDVVSSNCQHQERHDLDNDEWRGDPNPGTEAQGGHDGTADHQDPTQPNQKLGVHLQHQNQQIHR